jgi:tRNA uridine 5-carbamoylmethylation protein Kti12
MRQPEIVIVVGPPGSGKSTLSSNYEGQGYVRISGDDQGKLYMSIFEQAVKDGKDIIVDRMNFNKGQRDKFLVPTKKAGYKSTILNLFVPKEICRTRCHNRKDHPTIKNEQDAANALSFFFKSYEKPTLDEADTVVLNEALDIIQDKETVIICDIDGTVADIEHRRHHVRSTEGKKKDWGAFNREMVKDTPKTDVIELINIMNRKYKIVFCSGRTDDFRKETTEWLNKYFPNIKDLELYMRPRNDSRKDDIIKEIILDFEILPRYDVLFSVDDRDQVVAMWRKRGITCLQVDYGDF